MVNVSDTLKAIFKNDMFPLSPTIADKDIEAVFPSISLTVGTDQFAVDKGDLEINESICADGDLKFGKCNSSSVKFTVADVTDDIKGREFSLNQTINTGGTSYPVPLGIFKVDSANKQDDLRFKDIVAYDRMRKADTDVAAWYNSLFSSGTETYTLAQLRASFLTYVGLTQDTTKLPLPNDSMTVTKTIEPASLDGRMVIEAIEEINGVFGHINRSGQFTHIILKPAYGLYPSNDLYPSDTLYPVSETDATYTRSDLIDETITESMRQSIRFEEYTVKEIDKLIIRTDESDYGAIVGTGTNAYIIQGNFLIYGKSASELQTIATNAFGHMAKRPYRPYESDNIGLPYLEPGDMLKFDQSEPVVGYMLNRTISGIQSLRDNYSASGNQYREQKVDVNTEIKILQKKTLTIKKDVDGVRIEVTDLGANLSTEITALAGEVSVKVSKSDIIQSINLSTEGLKVDVTKIDINGLVTANGNFKIHLDGSMEALNGKFQGQITGGSININGNFIVNSDGTMSATGASISGSFTSTGTSGTVTINNGLVVATAIRATNIGNDGSRVSQIHVNTLYLDGEQFDPGLITTMYARGGGIDSPRNVYLDSNQNFVPSTTSYDFGLGSSSFPFDYLHIRSISHKSGGTLGLFGSTPSTKTGVSTLSTSATLLDAINKINSMITNSHGLY
jgi:hypothetical protein